MNSPWLSADGSLPKNKQIQKKFEKPKILKAKTTEQRQILWKGLGTKLELLGLLLSTLSDFWERPYPAYDR